MSSQIIHPTSSWLNAPWYISKDQLLQLDEIVNGELPRLEEKRNALISASVDEAIDRSITVYKHSKEDAEKRRAEMTADRKNDNKFQVACAILLKYGDQNKQATGESFQEIVHNPAITNEVPTGFAFRLNQHATNFEAVISVNKDGWMKVEASPNGDADAQRMYMKLLDWAKSVRPSIWYRLILPILSLIACFGLLFFVLITLAQIVPSTENTTSHQQYIHDAHKLLDSGITPQNEPQAIQLLLALETNYQGTVNIPYAGHLFIVTPWTIALLFVALFLLRPPIIIGVGAAESKLMIWKYVLNASWSIPLWILGAVFFDPLKDYLRTYFHFFSP
jgi:hypothetical protein